MSLVQEVIFNIYKKYLSRQRCMGSTASYEDLRGTGLITSDSQVWLQR